MGRSGRIRLTIDQMAKCAAPQSVRLPESCHQCRCKTPGRKVIFVSCVPSTNRRTPSWAPHSHGQTSWHATCEISCTWIYHLVQHQGRPMKRGNRSLGVLPSHVKVRGLVQIPDSSLYWNVKQLYIILHSIHSRKVGRTRSVCEWFKPSRGVQDFNLSVHQVIKKVLWRRNKS